ncbi:MAG: T9SS type A sorting domain-containing protein [Chitinophagaceae bacterium]|nr:MAG: T9SS type A sorting domain-containing protein [Chitinophagaceae bacterium]
MLSRIILIALLFFSLQASSQKIRFTDSANGWSVYTYSTWSPNIEGGDLFFYIQDTIDTGNQKQYRFMLSLSHTAFVREDTIAGKVYAKNIDLSYAPMDTNEIVLYDYSLLPGDTFIVSRQNQVFKTLVTKLDSVLINGIFHRYWVFGYVLGSNSVHDIVLEGLGSLTSPLFPYSNFEMTDYWDELGCFSGTVSGDITPDVIHSMGLPSVAVYQGCNLTHVSEQHPTVQTLYPQPASGDVTLKLFQPVPEGIFQLFDLTGKVVCKATIMNSETIVIPFQSIGGVYVWRLSDRSNGKSMAGKVIFN